MIYIHIGYLIRMGDVYCNNCGKNGHLYHNCKLPITSIGVIAFRILQNKVEYLMIRRKDTLGFIDFMRGKYSVQNKGYVMNMIKQMTTAERTKITTMSFNDLWAELWGIDVNSTQYRLEENGSRDKFNALTKGIVLLNSTYTLNSMVAECYQYSSWDEPEWGFPKGRRNYMEKDCDCGVREFCEETGYNKSQLMHIKNILPFEEIFTGSNYKSYKHKYFLCYMTNMESNNVGKYEPSEVSKMEWMSYENCLYAIRPYNLEKKRMLTCIHNSLRMLPLVHL
jgi:8-oxo-dGTP pyrophosphatase MutT (NUDIX family)